MKRRIIALLLILMLSLTGLSGLGEPAQDIDLPRSQAALSMMEYLESDPALMALMEASIARAHDINPDPNTNPVSTVEEFYDYIDWMVTCMPWNVLTETQVVQFTPYRKAWYTKDTAKVEDFMGKKPDFKIADYQGGRSQ